MKIRSSIVMFLLVLPFTPLATNPLKGEPLLPMGLLRQVIQNADTCMYYVSSDKEYLLDSWRDARAGDCVQFAGMPSVECDSSCAVHDGCMHPAGLGVVTGCAITECGWLARGLGECTYFESAELGRYVLSDQGGFAIGDSVRVSGTIERCMTECLDTSRCIRVQEIIPCGSSPVLDTTWGRIRAMYR